MVPSEEELKDREKRKQHTKQRIANMLRRRDESRVCEPSKGQTDMAVGSVRVFHDRRIYFFSLPQISVWQARLNQLTKLQNKCQGVEAREHTGTENNFFFFLLNSRFNYPHLGATDADAANFMAGLDIRDAAVSKSLRLNR